MGVIVNGMIETLSPGSVLVDGFVGARWRLRRERRSVRLLVELLRPFEDGERAALETEGERVLDFLAREEAERELEISRPAG